MDYGLWMYYHLLISYDLYTSALYEHWKLSRRPVKPDEGDEWRERERERETQGIPRYQRNLMMMMISYLPTPTLGQDMTQGQFLAEFNRFEFRAFFLLDLLHYLLFTHSWRENNWIHTFPKGISAMWNAITLVQDLNSYRRVHFLRR